MTTHTPPSSIIEINPDKQAERTVIWLHGLGADGSDFVPIVPELRLPASLNVRFVFPSAPIMPVTLNNGYEMRAWFDIYDLTVTAKIDQTGIEKSMQAVSRLIEAEVKRGISPENIILAGFSQGSVIALISGLCYDQPLGGVIALSGYLPAASYFLDKATPANKNIPIFLAHGTEDPVVPYAFGKATYTTLHSIDRSVSWHSYPMPHSVCAQEVSDISEWMQKLYSR